MQASFYRSNRQNLAAKLPDNALALFFSGFAPRKRADEDYPFFADRNFVYLTGIARDAGLILAIRKENGTYALSASARSSQRTLDGTSHKSRRSIRPLRDRGHRLYR